MFRRKVTDGLGLMLRIQLGGIMSSVQANLNATNL
jgi:hypothetical protein